jgi:hypothetical protein
MSTREKMSASNKKGRNRTSATKRGEPKLM